MARRRHTPEQIIRKRPVEGVCTVVRVPLVSQQLDLVATSARRIIEHSLNHHSRHAAATVLGADVHGLDESGGAACIGDVRHHQQRRRSYCVLAVPGQVHGEAIGPHHPTPRLQLSLCKVTGRQLWTSVDETCDRHEVLRSGRSNRVLRHQHILPVSVPGRHRGSAVA